MDGRVKKNDMFNRLEFMAQRVSPHPDPEEETKRLIEESKRIEAKKELPTVEEI